MKAFATNSQEGASWSKFGHMMTVASDAVMPAARPRAVMDEAVAFFGTRRTSLRQKLYRKTN